MLKLAPTSHHHPSECGGRLIVPIVEQREASDSVNAKNRNKQPHPLDSLQFLLSFLKDREREKEHTIVSLTGEEIGKLKTLWLIFSCYLEVLANQTSPSIILDELATQINQAHAKCQASPMAALLYARDAGNLLLEAKAELSPDRWEDWLNNFCKLSLRTSETYMQMAKGWPSLHRNKWEVDREGSAIIPEVIEESEVIEIKKMNID